MKNEVMENWKGENQVDTLTQTVSDLDALTVES